MTDDCIVLGFLVVLANLPRMPCYPTLHILDTLRTSNSTISLGHYRSTRFVFGSLSISHPAFCTPSLMIWLERYGLDVRLECYGLEESGRVLLSCVRFFFPGVFFFVRVTLIGSGVLVLTSSSTSY